MFIKSTELGEQLNNVLDIYNRIKGASKKHHGRESIRSLYDSFDIGRPEDKLVSYTLLYLKAFRPFYLVIRSKVFQLKSWRSCSSASSGHLII
ncbi:kinase-like protein [Penicillium canescens]|nr:kinase-like protein [Penicillium canescens]